MMGAKMAQPVMMAAPSGFLYAPEWRGRRRIVSYEEMFAAGMPCGTWSGAVPEPSRDAYQILRGGRGRAVRRRLRRWRASR